MKILSIAVPAYNVEKYIERCLITFIDVRIMERLEVIVINDGSTDKTEEIVKNYVEKYPNTIRLITKINGGHGSAVNSGIEHASGKYFRVVDGDDWVDIKELVKCVDKLCNTDVDIVSMHYDRVDMNSGEITSIKEENIEYDKIYKFEDLKVEERYFTLASSCFKTSLLKSLDFNFQENTYFVDVEYIIMPIIKVEEVMFLDISVYKYFVGNVNQSINIENMVKRYEHHERVIKSCIAFINSVDMTEQHKKYVYSILKKVIYTHYSILIIYNKDKVKGRELSLEFDEYLSKVNPKLYKEVYIEFKQIGRLKKSGFDYRKWETSIYNRVDNKLDRSKQYIKKYRNLARKTMKIVKDIILRRR